MKKANKGAVPGRQELQAIVKERVTKQEARSPSRAEPDAALKALHEELVDAARAYRKGPSQQRQGVCDAIAAVLEFLKGQGFSDAILEPLKRPAFAIVDLCRQNRADPLFAEKRKTTKPMRSMQEAILQGHLAALASQWLECDNETEGGPRAKLSRAARALSGRYFGKLDEKSISSAINYQRQSNHHPLLYQAFEQMECALRSEADAAGGGTQGGRLAVITQVKILNLSGDRQS